MKPKQIDIFQWANNIDAEKRELNVELFLFNKNYTPYSIRHSSALAYQLPPLFLYDLIGDATKGAVVGSALAELEAFDSSRHMIAHTPLEKVGRAATLLHIIENEHDDILEFSNDEHEFKRIIGVVARFTHPTNKNIKFHVVKLLPQTQAVTGATAWQINEGQFEPMTSDVALKIPSDNQVLIVSGGIFIFDVSKFTKLFKYDVQEVLLSDEKGAALSKKYKLSMLDLFDDFAVLARSKRTTLKKLLDVDVSKLPDQETVVEIADEMAVELMTDDSGAIILFDANDASKLLDIINDNYLTGAAGNHYLAKSKKPLGEKEQ